MPEGGPEPGTAAMIVASTSRNATGNRSTITGRFLSRARAVPSLRKQTSARAGLRHAASDSRLRFGETLAAKKWWIHLPSEAKSTCHEGAQLLCCCTVSLES